MSYDLQVLTRNMPIVHLIYNQHVLYSLCTNRNMQSEHIVYFHVLTTISIIYALIVTCNVHLVYFMRNNNSVIHMY